MAAGADPHAVTVEDNTAYDYAYAGSRYSTGPVSPSKQYAFMKWYEDRIANWKPKKQASKAPTTKAEGKKTPDVSEGKVASPKKSESGVPSYGTVGDCADLMKGHDPESESIALTILKRNNIGCYTVPNRCLDLLSSESDEAINAMLQFLRVAEVFCYQ